MVDSKHTPEVIAARGRAIYERDIRGKLENDSKGKYLVLDIETGEFEIDRNDLIATQRSLAKRPGAVLYGLRVGYLAAYRL